MNDDLRTMFEARISPEPNTGCWLWIGAHASNGYGVFGSRWHRGYAHRLAWELFHGPIPAGLQIDHLCRVRSCVNPAHLEPVTQAVNKARGEAGQHNARKTHCPYGHEYTPANVKLSKLGGRQCKRCRILDQRRRRARLAGLLLGGLMSCAAAKGRPSGCVTACGMEAETARCGALQRFEKRVVRVLANNVTGWDSKQVCAALDGWTVQVHVRALDEVCDVPSWSPAPISDLCVVGFTHPAAQVLEVDSDRWETNSLAHEMVHAIDFKSAGKLIGHCSWADRGIWKTLSKITGEPSEPSAMEPCP